MSKINDIRLKQAMKIQATAEWNCGEHPEILQDDVKQYSDGILQEHIEQCLDEMLALYISDERNYVVDCAEIECTEMSDATYCIKYENETTTLYDVIQGIGKGVVRNDIPPGKSPGEEVLLGKELDMDKVRRLYALHTKDAEDNGIRYATVVDTTCLRDVKEGTGHPTSSIEGKLSCEASIVSCGNCGIRKESDIDEIEKRLDESKKYGTCYSLIKPVSEWVNPLCAESVSGNCDQKVKDFMFGTKLIKVPCDSPDHHKVMEFDTNYGTKQGLTMLSTLLCTRGGVITIKVHGQIYLDTLEKRIQDIIDSIDGDSIYTLEEMRNLSTAEILARMIFQESHTYMYSEQNAVLYSLINRLFSDTNFTYNEEQTLRNILLAEGQYKSLLEYSTAYYPPKNEKDDDYYGWENAKRLTAILMVALEDNVPNYHFDMDIGEIVIVDMGVSKQDVVEMIGNQNDRCGKTIDNPIDGKVYFRAVDKEYEAKEGEIIVYTDGIKERGGHVFYD